MAIYREDIVDIDLESGSVNRSFVNKMLGEADAYGNRFGVRIMRNGREENLNGVTCTGYFKKQNGTTVPIAGSKSGSKFWVELPGECYETPGCFTLAIKLTKSETISGETVEKTVTARIVDGTVVQTEYGSFVDPGDLIPDISALQEYVDDILAAAQVIEEFELVNDLISGTRYRIIVKTANDPEEE